MILFEFVLPDHRFISHQCEKAKDCKINVLSSWLHSCYDCFRLPVINNVNDYFYRHVCNRILNKFLDNYQEDLLPWHESIEPSLSSMTACINDREVVICLYIAYLCAKSFLFNQFGVFCF